MASISNKAGWSIAIAVSLVLAATLAGWVHAGGPLDPQGAPGVTMKSLSEVEPRTPISSLPFTISQPGSYYLTGNLGVSTAIDGITVQADDVTIDLNGFELNGNGVGSGAFTQGAASPARRNWRVYNGSIVGWGYALYGGSVSHGQIDHVRASGIRTAGLYLGAGARVSDCSVEGSGPSTTQGILTGDGSSVESCSTRGFSIGIWVVSQSTVAGCNVIATNIGVSASGSTIASCRIAAIHQGINADGQSAIFGNQIDMTGASPLACGITFGLGSSSIDGNRVTNSPKGVCLSLNSGSTATRNSFYNMTTAAFTGYTGNDVPSVVAAGAVTNPLANICVSPPGTCGSTP